MTPEAFLATHQNSAYVVASTFIIPGMEPEDLQQEAMLVLLELVDNPKAAQKGYCTVAVRNHLLNLKALGTRLVTTGDQAGEGPAIDEFTGLPDVSGGMCATRRPIIEFVSLDEPIDTEQDGDGLTLNDVLPDPSPNAEDVLIAAENDAELHAAVANLPARDRSVITLHSGMHQVDQVGISLRQTAKVLNISVAQAKTSWHRGICSIRSTIALHEAA